MEKELYKKGDDRQMKQQEGHEFPFLFYRCPDPQNKDDEAIDTKREDRKHQRDGESGEPWLCSSDISDHDTKRHIISYMEDVLSIIIVRQ